ncbi:hypothetical protein C7974DRAFT_186385 [Boeremia exigua]|uniref:uncharacterized protein n=1 Tax=Boeremia exigua TaxID=749465 RepID=UPI001E8EE313|nr:uncharacterized protein C7974DRAFT_186385 [Boeremia exigua]KAH6629442.1 hypothetical protein C7974DRAFT_186385 [Boeremia exigua]
MSLLHLAPSLFETAMEWLAFEVSRIEAEILHIPSSMRFFTVEADTDQRFKEAFLFALAPFYAFITMPLLDRLRGIRHPKSRSDRSTRCGEWYLWYLVMFWTVILLNRHLL